MREDFSRVKDAMEEGRTLLLMYRSQPLAQIKPIFQKTVRKVRPRFFSLKRMREWIKDDQLTEKQRARIYAIFNRLS